MQSANNQDSLRLKRSLRAQALAARRALGDRVIRSAAIARTLNQQPAYGRAESILFYVQVRDEVQTIDAILTAIDDGKNVSVPYCVEDQLALFEFRELSDLEPGAFGVLEPRQSLRDEPGRYVDAANISLVIVPGVAFDRHGGRLGYGKGFYDRLLGKTRGRAMVIGLAFDCQVFEEVPMEAHDIRMDLVITESTTYARHSAHPRS